MFNKHQKLPATKKATNNEAKNTERVLIKPIEFASEAPQLIDMSYNVYRVFDDVIGNNPEFLNSITNVDYYGLPAVMYHNKHNLTYILLHNIKERAIQVFWATVTSSTNPNVHILLNNLPIREMVADFIRNNRNIDNIVKDYMDYCAGNFENASNKANNEDWVNITDIYVSSLISSICGNIGAAIDMAINNAFFGIETIPNMNGMVRDILANDTNLGRGKIGNDVTLSPYTGYLIVEIKGYFAPIMNMICPYLIQSCGEILDSIRNLNWTKPDQIYLELREKELDKYRKQSKHPQEIPVFDPVVENDDSCFGL